MYYFYRCIHEYTFEGNDGNGPFKTTVLYGEMFAVEYLWQLPGNGNNGERDSNFERVFP